MIRRQLVTGALMTVALLVLLGVVYPLAMTAVAQVTMGHKADGSLVSSNGQVVGSSLIGQTFLTKDGKPDPRYFQPRPSAAGDGYDGLASGGSNLGPSNPTLIDDVKQRVADYRSFNNVPAATAVPADAVTASASGLDPGISVANARLQATRVATARGLPVGTVQSLIGAHTTKKSLGILGEDYVDVLELNLALDAQRP